MNSGKVFNKDNRAYYFSLVCISLFFLFVFRCVPVTHDALDSRFFYHIWGGLPGTIAAGIRRYFLVNGRVLATIVASFFEQNDILLDIGSTAVMTATVWLGSKHFSGNRQLWAAWSMFALMLSVSASIRVEVYFYAVLFYIVGVLLGAQAIYSYYHSIFENPGSTKAFHGALIWVALSCLWVEHIAFGMTAALGLMCVSRLVLYRRLAWREVILSLVAALSTFILILSTFITGSREIISKSLSLPHLIAYNLSEILRIMFFRQPLIWLFCFVTTFVFIMKRDVKAPRKHRKHLILTVEGMYIIAFSLLSANTLFPGIVPFVQSLTQPVTVSVGFILQSAFWVAGFFALLLPLFLSTEKNLLLPIYFAALFSLLPSVVTPNIGDRIGSFAVLMIIMCYVRLFVSLQLAGGIGYGMRTMQALVCLALVFGLDTYFSEALQIKEIQDERVTRIEHAKIAQAFGRWDYDDILTLPVFSPDQLYCTNGYPMIDVHYRCFLSYYNLNADTLISYSNTDDKLIAIKEGERQYLLTYVPAGNVKSAQMDFLVCDYGITYVDSGPVSEFSWRVNIPEDIPRWFFKVQVIKDDGTVLLVSNPLMLGEW